MVEKWIVTKDTTINYEFGNFYFKKDQHGNITINARQHIDGTRTLR